MFTQTPTLLQMRRHREEIKRPALQPLNPGLSTPSHATASLGAYCTVSQHCRIASIWCSTPPMREVLSLRNMREKVCRGACRFQRMPRPPSPHRAWVGWYSRLAGEGSDTEIGVCAAEVVNGGFFPLHHGAVFLRYVFRLGPGEY